MLLRTFQPGSMARPSVTRSAAPAGGLKARIVRPGLAQAEVGPLRLPGRAPICCMIVMRVGGDVSTASGRHFSAVGAGIVRVVDGKVECSGLDGDRICRSLFVVSELALTPYLRRRPRRGRLAALRVNSAVGDESVFDCAASRRHSASCSTGGRFPIELCSRRVLNHATHSTIASSSLVLERQTRSRISSVLNESTKLSAMALS